MDDFKRDNDLNNRKEDGQKVEKEDENESRKEYYYSYGPFKSDVNDLTAVEVTPPKAIRAYSAANAQPPSGMWTYPSARKRNVFKSMFLSFLAGAVVVGSLMFASDRMNLFTVDAPDTPVSVQEAGAGSNLENTADGIRTASLNIVRPNTIADIAASASPAVVKIETYVTRAAQRSNPLLEDDFFRYWFGDQFDGFGMTPDPNQGEKRPGGMGSGFIFEQSGYVLTNEHVIADSDEIFVVVEGHQEPFKATRLGADYDLDLAVLKIEGSEPFPTLKMGDSASVRVGDWLTAIGNPVGFDHTVSVGVLSAREREIQISDQKGVRKYKNLLQTDASINPGNSGGPLLNLEGEVIGINTAVSAQAQGIGFAIPTSTIADVLEHLKNNKEIPKPPAPYLGVGLQDIDTSWLGDLMLDSTDGAIITQVEFNSPAHRAGLKTYDVIVEMNGSKIKNATELVEKVKQLKVSDKVTLTIVRSGKKYATAVIVGDRNNKTE